MKHKRMAGCIRAAMLLPFLLSACAGQEESMETLPQPTLTEAADAPSVTGNAAFAAVSVRI